jgi:hypothetical protein
LQKIPFERRGKFREPPLATVLLVAKYSVELKICPVCEGYLRKIPVSKTGKFPSQQRRLAKFASSLKRYILQMTLSNRIYLHRIFMFFPKCAPNGILGVEGTLAYVAQNCQWLAHIPPMGFPWSLLWLLERSFIGWSWSLPNLKKFDGPM